MRFLNKQQTQTALPWSELIAALREQFQTACVVPSRHHHSFEIPQAPAGTLLLMPAWTEGEFLGVKLVTIAPGNRSRGLPAISGSYTLFSAMSGELLSIFDGGELTARRTAAASALAASFLARRDSKILLVVGAGRLAPNLIQAHCSVRPIERVLVWARRVDASSELSAQMCELGFNATPVEDLANAVSKSCIVTCCTLSESPLVEGKWLTPGTHLDLVGAFKPSMREADDEAVNRAAIFVDTMQGALSEGGDLAQAIANGVISESDIVADLHHLCRQEHPGRTSAEQVTLFKSVGTALEDLAAAKLAFRSTAALPSFNNQDIES